MHYTSLHLRANYIPALYFYQIALSAFLYEPQPKCAKVFLAFVYAIDANKGRLSPSKSSASNYVARIRLDSITLS